MSAYYNEIDPSAAQWLRNLIAAGHIAPGEVDERSKYTHNLLVASPLSRSHTPPPAAAAAVPLRIQACVALPRCLL